MSVCYLSVISLLKVPINNQPPTCWWIIQAYMVSAQHISSPFSLFLFTYGFLNIHAYYIHLLYCLADLYMLIACNILILFIPECHKFACTWFFFEKVVVMWCNLIDSSLLTGYWGMYLIGVSLGYNLFFDNSSKGKSRSSQVVKVWVLAASFW